MKNKNWIYLLIILAAVIFLYRVKIILTPFFFALVIAYLAYPIVAKFEARGVPRSVSIILVYFIIGIIVGIAIYFLIPHLANDVEEILQVLPKQTERLEDMGQGVLRGLQSVQVPDSLQEAFDLVVNRIQRLLEGIASRIADLLVTLVSQIISIIIAPFLAFYMLRDFNALKPRILLYIPLRYRKDVNYLVAEINQILNGYVRGQLVMSAIVGLLVAIGLTLLGIRYAFFIGFLAGLFDIIPYFGPAIGFIPAAALALVKSPLSVLWVFLMFFLVNQLEASIISPKVLGERVGLHPLAVIFAVLAGGEVMGIMGMLIAVPITAILRMLILYLVQKLDGVNY
ncbi:MAG: AI-2E family transporter [Firmicutes bacterium]|nr:AI-2E family transporter [Bacillota bacterium]